MTIRILLCDDHRMFREAMRIPLAAEADIEVVGEACNGAETLSLLGSLAPDILVLDIALPDMTGMEVARQVRERHSAVKIVALSGYADKLFVTEMLKAGAQGYVVKSAGAEELVGAIRAVAAGHNFLSPEVTRTMVHQFQAAGEPCPPPVSVLGKRELAVLCLLVVGKRSAAIAEELEISAATVEVHRRNIKKKLGLYTVAELTRYAIREGLLAS